MKTSLSLKYRPQKFSEIAGQEHIKNILINALKKGRVANAYLFAGPRGTGKTSTARILAKALNCLNPQGIEPCNKCIICNEISNSSSLDVIEIDGASNRGIEEIRGLREKLRYKPVKGKYRIYIIDEVHMLTNEAFNALLKVLEEPPSHVIFIFATTHPQNIPLTILSRCQRFDFRPILSKEIIGRLKDIVKKEQIKIEDKAIKLIAEASKGALRDAEMRLEQVSSFSDKKISIEDVEEMIGLVPEKEFETYLNLILSSNYDNFIRFMDNLLFSGFDILFFYYSLLDYIFETYLKKENTNNIRDILYMLIDAEHIIKDSFKPHIAFSIVSFRIMNKFKTSSLTPSLKTQKNTSTKQKEDSKQTKIHEPKKAPPKKKKTIENILKKSNIYEDEKSVIIHSDMAQILNKNIPYLKEKYKKEIIIKKEENETGNKKTESNPKIENLIKGIEKYLQAKEINE